MDLGLTSQLESADQMGKSGNTSSIAVGCCNEDEEEEEIRRTPASEVEKEHMFDKVVTPSDVGKLNRLVIPKQHAEKYFPLDAAVNDKGLLLNFEDARSGGNLWRFRYSYWNSSQSYVMTKGWSRFVKHKKLDAGDIVSFHRGRGDGARDRLFIDCRRRVDLPPPPLLPPSINSSSDPRQQLHHYFPLQRSVPWNPMLMRPPSPPYYGRGSVVYLGSAAPAMGIGMLEWPHQLVPQEPAIVFDSIPVVQGKVAGKRLRLFGVNMETAEQQAMASPAAQCSSRQVIQYPKSSSNAAETKGKSSMSLDFGI